MLQSMRAYLFVAKGTRGHGCKTVLRVEYYLVVPVNMSEVVGYAGWLECKGLESTQLALPIIEYHGRLNGLWVFNTRYEPFNRDRNRQRATLRDLSSELT